MNLAPQSRGCPWPVWEAPGRFHHPGLIGRIVLTPVVAWGEIDVRLDGDLGAALEWTATGDKKQQPVARVLQMSVSVIVGLRDPQQRRAISAPF